MALKLEHDKEEIPLHFETVTVRGSILVVGWMVAVSCIIVGVALAAGAKWMLVESLGVVLAGLGGVVAVLLVRCRRVEVVVTRRLLTVSAGPLRRRVPVGFIEGCESRSATSWRRFFADREGVLRGGHDGRNLVVPTGDPVELASVLGDREVGQ